MFNAEDGADIARPLFGQHVVDGALRADGFEFFAVAAGQPRGHVAAIATAEHADSIGIAEGKLCESTVQYGKNVLDVSVAPARAGSHGVLATKNCLAPRLLASAGAARIAHEHHKASRCLHLCFVKERFAVLRVWSAVHVEQHGVFFLRVEVLRLHDPRVDLGRTADVRRSARHREVLPRLWGDLTNRVGAEAADAALGAVDDGEYFGQLIHCARDEADGGPSSIQTFGDATTGGNPLRRLLAGWVETYDVSGATILGVRQQRPIVHPDRWD